MSLPLHSRRRFLARALLLAPLAGAACVGDALVLEPNWLRVRTLRLGEGQPRHRFVHFTDVHFKGDPGALNEVVERINGLKPDFACFTGDLIEEAAQMPGAVAVLSRLRVPLYAIPGNHEHWSRAPLGPLAEVCAKTGGFWMPDRQRLVAGGAINLIGLDRMQAGFVPQPGRFNLLMIHYPILADRLGGRRCDLILAGHSHGGQVRLPFYGALVKPSHVGRYDLGWFETPGGPLYVNPGIGTLGDYNIRFNCRPELTVFEV